MLGYTGKSIILSSTYGILNFLTSARSLECPIPAKKIFVSGNLLGIGWFGNLFNCGSSISTGGIYKFLLCVIVSSTGLPVVVNILTGVTGTSG